MGDNIYESAVIALDQLQTLIDSLEDQDYEKFGGIAESIINHHRCKICRLMGECECKLKN